MEKRDSLLDRFNSVQARVLAAAKPYRMSMGALPPGYDPRPLLWELTAIYGEACALPATIDALMLRARILVSLGLLPPFRRASRRALAEAKALFHDLRRITGELSYEENARCCANLARLHDFDAAIAAWTKNGVLNPDGENERA